ncbi:MAG: TonB-dependent receptor [Hyphomonadaceae bacterium]
MSKKSNWGRILLSGASLAAMGAFSPALAQDAEEVTDEIVVTATGRAAAIQDVPLAVTAVTGDQIEASGVDDLRDLTQLAPSFSMGTGQSLASTTARIRGIGTGADNVGFEAAVGIFIDGVYRARPGAALSDLPELERVEVLRGPQGTLFGRNTSAGALSVVTVGPRFEPGMSIEGELGLDDLEGNAVQAMVNMPVSDTLALRVDGGMRARDGYLTDVISGDDINTVDRWTGRAQALWDISPDASLRVIVDASESNEVCCGITPLVYGSTQAAMSGISLALIGNTGSPAINVDNRLMSVTPGLPGLPAGVTFLPIPSGGGGVGITGLPSFPAQPAGPARNYGDDSEDFGVSAQLDWDLGGVSLTSITALRNWEQTRNQDIDFHSTDVAYRYGDQVGANTFTQEIRLAGEVGRINWLAGVFYSNEETSNLSNIQTGAHATGFVNLAAVGGTRDPDGAGPAPAPFAFAPAGCELYDSTAGDVDGVSDPIPSLFYCATGGLALANVYLAGNVNGQGQQGDRWEVETQSISAFTHNEIALSDQLTWTIGARFTDEDKDISANLFSTSRSCDSLRTVETISDPVVPGPGVGIVSALQINPSLNPLMNLACNPAVNPISNGVWAGSQSEQEWSGTTSLAYNFNDDVMIYGGYSRGYKAGGFNMDRQGFAVTPALTSAASLSIYQTQFDPEFTDAYEIGLKSTILGGSTTFNVAGFYQQIHDYQLNAYNGFNFITRNVPELISQGVEVEMTSRPVEGLFLNAGVTWNDAYYDSSVSFNALTLAASCPTPTPCSADPNSVVSGDPLSFAPEWTVTGAISYTIPIGETLQTMFYLDGRWVSEYRTQTLGRDPAGRTDNEAFALFNGRISLGPQDERWSLELWGQNLTDELYYVGAFSPPLQNSYVVYPNVPATYGVTMRLQY